MYESFRKICGMVWRKMRTIHNVATYPLLYIDITNKGYTKHSFEGCLSSPAHQERAIAQPPDLQKIQTKIVIQ